MKSERRHELHQNVLQLEIAKTWAFLKAKSNTLAWIMLVLAVLALAYAWWHNNRLKKDEEFQAKYTQLIVRPSGELKPDERLAQMKELANNDTNDQRAAATCYQIGAEFAAQMLLAAPTERKTLADEAVRWYEQILQRFPKERLMTAKAHVGLARVNESLGDFDAARKELKAVADMADLAGYPLVADANLELAQLDQIKQPVVMSTSQPTTAPTATSTPANSPAKTATAPAGKPAPAAKK